jgi:hypothetical protein
MDKANENYFKSFEIKMAWWLTPFPFPQGNESSIPTMAKLNKGKWGERGARARVRSKVKTFKMLNWPNLNMIFCKFFLLLVENFRLEIKLY